MTLNLLFIVVTVNVLLILGLCIVAFVAGYLLRTSFIRECKNKIFELEREMLRDNARILELEKEKAELLKGSVKK